MMTCVITNFIMSSIQIHETQMCLHVNGLWVVYISLMRWYPVMQSTLSMTPFTLLIISLKLHCQDLFLAISIQTFPPSREIHPFQNTALIYICDSKIKGMENCCNFTSYFLKDCYNSPKGQLCNPFTASYIANGLLFRRAVMEKKKNTNPFTIFYMSGETRRREKKREREWDWEREC